MIEALKRSSTKKKSHVDAEKLTAINAWHRVDCRTREALRRSFLSELIDGYEFYDLVSVTITRSCDETSKKMTKIKRKKAGFPELPNITLCQFLKMSKEGNW
ncbi:hypothetical protein GIB67_028075 [Kingdonia uniflora]|uniref:Uncharacterized protein n=1 Tax=Kingdonia uniflora TaxID=39325 RepID=A0A7J7L180_9MAGN|nr:hypothetical protein GIB67_028075 [Kingdonia uniflora]